MIDVNIAHISKLFFALHEEAISYYLSADEYNEYYFNIDLRNFCHFQKWFPRIFRADEMEYVDYSDMKNPYFKLLKNSLKFLILSRKTIENDIYLPGIDSIENGEFFWNEYYIFLIRVYQYLFKEQFVYEDISKFRERIDKEFVENPSKPELWKEPIYK